MLFKEVIGQQAVKQSLIRSVQEQRVSHAQLFLGAEGAGALPLALAYAQYLNCLNPQPDDACGSCPSCQKIQKLIHPDIHFSYPFIKKKNPGNAESSNTLSTDWIKEWREAVADNPYMNVYQWLQRLGPENKQGNITIHECHNIIKRLNLKSFEARYKVLILWMPEFLGKNGNSLLKIIEEPPENTIFLLVAENQEPVLNTILSRTQIIKVPKLKEQDIQQAILQKYDLGSTEALRAAQLCDGNFNEALRLLTQAENDQVALLTGWYEACSNDDAVAVSELVDELAGLGRENQKNFLQYMLHFLRETLMLSLIDSHKVRLQEQEIKLAKQLLSRIKITDLEEIIDQISKSYYHIERNAHPKILFMNLSVLLSKILQREKAKAVGI